MNIIYNGVDITNNVTARECTYTDSCDDRADLLEITFERAQDWETWKPVYDDEIRVTHELIDTGVMYVTEIEPNDGKYTIRCSTLKRSTREKRWISWCNVTLDRIMKDCTELCGMGWALFGVDPHIRYDFISMQYESIPAFLMRLMNMEGAVLKCCSGRMIGIGVQYANGLHATQKMQLTDAKSNGITRTVMPYAEWKSVTAYSYYGNAKASDQTVKSGDNQTFTFPACNRAEAKRWAAGMLMTNNMRSESIDMRTQLNSGLTAMGRLDIDSATDAKGEWLVREVTHDIIAETSMITLCRCRKGVV